MKSDMKENELYVTERGIFIGIKTISGRSAFVTVLSQRDGKVIVQKKEMVIVDRDVTTLRDPISGVETPVTMASAEQVEVFQGLINGKASVAEDKQKTRAVHTLTRMKNDGPQRI